MAQTTTASLKANAAASSRIVSRELRIAWGRDGDDWPTDWATQSTDETTRLLDVSIDRRLDMLSALGQGAGPVAQMRLTLVESIQKKAGFCAHVVERLGLRQVQVLAERAEDVGQDPNHRESYDLATARAVAAMPTLVEYLLPLVRIGGLVIMQKGESAQLEALKSEKVIQRLGGKIRVILPVELPGVADERYLVVLEKVARTSAEYPRRTGLPAKQPLE